VLFRSHGNELRYYQSLAGKGPTSDYQIATILSPTFWRHENVRYLYTTADDSVIRVVAQQLRLDSVPKLLVGPVRNAAGSEVYLYRLPGDNPPAWVASTGVKATDEQAHATVLDPRFDPARAAILDSATSFGDTTMRTLPEASSIKAAVELYKPGHIALRLSSPAAPGNVLVVSENYFPGWRATVAGKQATVARADYNLIGVSLPAGAQEVDLRFDDLAYERGKLITLLALTLAVVALLVGIVLSRSSAPRRPIAAA